PDETRTTRSGRRARGPSRTALREPRLSSTSISAPVHVTTPVRQCGGQTRIIPDLNGTGPVPTGAFSPLTSQSAVSPLRPRRGQGLSTPLSGAVIESRLPAVSPIACPEPPSRQSTAPISRFPLDRTTKLDISCFSRSRTPNLPTLPASPFSGASAPL